MNSKSTCAHCGHSVKQAVGAINRARRQGKPLYCNRTCAGLARRSGKTKAQRVAEKRLYDMEYRRLNLERITAEKRAYFERTYDPAKAAAERKANMARHVAYCQRPEYKAWKRDYDKRYLAKRHYGPFEECALLLRQIEEEISSRMSRYDIYMANGTINKSKQRKRDYESSFGYCP